MGRKVKYMLRKNPIVRNSGTKLHPENRKLNRREVGNTDLAKKRALSKGIYLIS